MNAGKTKKMDLTIRMITSKLPFSSIKKKQIKLVKV